MTQQPPAITVLIAVHNGLPYLESAVRSIMEQTFEDIEILIVDDASSDDSPAVLARLADEDQRIRVITLETNLRLPGALNRGLDEARAPLVARMDADDLAHPRRLEIQKAYMDAHPKVSLCGMSVRNIDAAGRVLKPAIRPRDTVATRWLARFFMPLTHPTFVFRSRFEDGTAPRYHTDFPVTEDYDFVTRLLEKGQAVTLPDIGLDYRMHSQSTTHTQIIRQKVDARIIAQRFQTHEMPFELCEALAPFNAAFLGYQDTDPRALYAGLRAMITHDSALHPGHRRWIKRQGAQMAYIALRNTKRARIATLGAFARHGADFLPALALRAGETKRALPTALRSGQLFFRSAQGL